MKMSKGHFEALAEALKYERPKPNWSANKWVQWEMDVKAIAEVCHSMSNFTPNGNRAFDRDKFYRACGLRFDEDGFAIREEEGG